MLSSVTLTYCWLLLLLLLLLTSEKDVGQQCPLLLCCIALQCFRARRYTKRDGSSVGLSDPRMICGDTYCRASFIKQ